MVKPSLSKKSSGFTLVELLVVITILGMLASIVLLNINIKKRKDDASNAAIRSNLINLSNGLESFQAVRGSLPADAADKPDGLGSSPLSDFVRAGWPDGYIYKVDQSEGYFAIYTEKAGSITGVYLKYSSYFGIVQECVGTVSIISVCDPPPSE